MVVNGVWDNLELETRVSEPKLLKEMTERLSCMPGIAHFLQVDEYPLGDFDDILAKCMLHYGDALAGKIFRFAASAPASTRSVRWTWNVMSAASCAGSAAPPVFR